MSHYLQGIELVMRYFVSTELGVANLIQRHFDWSSNALWYEEIPNAQDASKTLFILGGKDSIMNSEVSISLYPCNSHNPCFQPVLARQAVPHITRGTERPVV